MKSISCAVELDATEGIGLQEILESVSILRNSICNLWDSKSQPFTTFQLINSWIILLEWIIVEKSLDFQQTKVCSNLSIFYLLCFLLLLSSPFLHQVSPLIPKAKILVFKPNTSKTQRPINKEKVESTVNRFLTATSNYHWHPQTSSNSTSTMRLFLFLFPHRHIWTSTLVSSGLQ